MTSKGEAFPGSVLSGGAACNGETRRGEAFPASIPSSRPACNGKRVNGSHLCGNASPLHLHPGVRPPISITTGAFYVYPLRAAFRLIADAGLDTVELVAGPELWARGCGYVRGAAREHGIRVLTVHPPILPFPGWKDIPANLQRMAQIALAVGAEVLCIHPPDAPTLDCTLSRRFVDALESTLRSLEGTGTKLALENLAHFSRTDARLWWHDPAHLLALAEEMDLPLVLDTAHADSTPLGVNGVYEMFRGRIANVHLSDVRRPSGLVQTKYLQTLAKHHQIPGEGDLPLQALIVDLLARSYAGPLTLELSPIALAIWSPREARKRLARAREWTERALRTEGDR